MDFVSESHEAGILLLAKFQEFRQLTLALYLYFFLSCIAYFFFSCYNYINESKSLDQAYCVLVLNCSRSGLVRKETRYPGKFPRYYTYAVLKSLYLEGNSYLGCEITSKSWQDARQMVTAKIEET